MSPYTTPMLPSDKPRYLMGVGFPRDIVEGVAAGVDMFDCVLPTRSGRHGQAWTWEGPVNLKNARFAEDDTPLDPDSDVPASRDYSKAYLHHLVKSGEILAQAKSAKLIVFKMKKRKGYHKKNGHRQQFSKIKIESIKG